MGADYTVKTVEREEYEDVEPEECEYENNQVLLDEKSEILESTEEIIPKALSIDEKKEVILEEKPKTIEPVEQVIPKALSIDEGILDDTKIQFGKKLDQELPTPRTITEDSNDDINKLKNLLDHIENENFKPFDIVKSCEPDNMSNGIESKSQNELDQNNQLDKLTYTNDSLDSGISSKTLHDFITPHETQSQNAVLADLCPTEHITLETDHQETNITNNQSTALSKAGFAEKEFIKIINNDASQNKQNIKNNIENIDSPENASIDTLEHDGKTYKHIFLNIINKIIMIWYKL